MDAKALIGGDWRRRTTNLLKESLKIRKKTIFFWTVVEVFSKV